MLKTLDVVKHERGSRAFRQPRDRALQIDPQLRRITRRKGADLTRVLHREHSRDATLAAPRVLEHRVYGESVQPRRERRLTTEFPEIFPCANKNILHQVGRSSLLATREPQ